MNVSSLIITTPVEYEETVIQLINENALCEYHAHKDGKIVVTIEAASVNDEVKVMKLISKMQHVISVEMIYSYCEDELEQERDKLELEGKIPDWLNEENAKAEDIVYNGHIKF
ncbi:chaperone NapD [Draconibacterium sediminis]|uniref:Chaperone NapD n=1 Tax=Draconibacterium sediminis TaxID=1544798 RepID=A0A0D8JAW6_9BACT|nr:chaperone NapD [Draconibacterium sediminis]KJF43666.1 hypothetical protein LH29_11210 [Draconibacterium sediminis]